MSEFFIAITEAKAAGLGVNGGKRVRAAAAANFAAADFSIGADLARGHVGRAVVAQVTESFWTEVLKGEADERVLACMMDALLGGYTNADAAAEALEDVNYVGHRMHY